MTGPVDAAFAAALRASEPVALATVVDGPNLGAKLLVRPGAGPLGTLGDADLDRVVARDAAGELESGITVTRHYGAHGEARLSKRMNARVGIVGHVYATGVAYMTDDVVDDPFFYPTLDLTDGFQTKSGAVFRGRLRADQRGVSQFPQHPAHPARESLRF